MRPSLVEAAPTTEWNRRSQPLLPSLLQSAQHEGLWWLLAISSIRHIECYRVSPNRLVEDSQHLTSNSESVASIKCHESEDSKKIRNHQLGRIISLEKYPMLAQMISLSGSYGDSSSVCNAGSANSADSGNGFVPFGGRGSFEHNSNESVPSPILINDQERSGFHPISVKWEAIVARFQTRFQTNFMTSKKVKMRHSKHCSGHLISLTM